MHQNFEYFNNNPKPVDHKITKSLSERIFNLRVNLVAEIDKLNFLTITEKQKIEVEELRRSNVKFLHDVITNMTFDNVIVRPKRRLVEKFRKKLHGIKSN